MNEKGSHAYPGPSRDVCAIVVTYNPDITRLRACVDAVRKQAGGLLIFDNATTDPEFDRFVVGSQNEAIVRSPANIGLAAAINRGIRHAGRNGFSRVLVLDQDSIPAPDMVATLCRALDELGYERKAAAVGPQFQDTRNGVLAPFVRVGFPFNRKLYGGPGERIQCDFLISSGSLIPLRVLEEVGGMDESLFIDNVDLEWSFRVRHRGYRLYGICDAKMGHSIGDSVRPSRWVRGGRFVHGPVRLYYMMRNRVLLYGRKETPAKWIAQDVLRLFGKLARMSLLVAPRGRNLRAMCRGLWDGLRGRSGPMPAD
ncbi:glycosyltransferase family 2 protein [Pseudoxanthomonas helianthi]|uniref:Glycosyltransferase family 2 protein n=1 Tax=Pseudoxanthomonas helianthi TaxID=1453541 RepID=A0A940X3N7_9GAMM|nr:glycosyltransferase family 2 protein [Pseudoxanthomonas helianthi]MBP3984592.1 glycosyltransferase family 2 protein [Pseudoxanthomonas helianthi]